MEAQKILNEIEVSRLIGLSLATLRNWRCLGRGPVYFKLGRAVRYSPADIAEYLEKNRINPEFDQ